MQNTTLENKEAVESAETSATTGYQHLENLTETEPKKLPAWAVLIAVLAFVIFNAFFLVFAMQMGSGNPG